MDHNQYFQNLEAPAGKIDVVLDTDAYNEIDDQFAIAYLLGSKDRLNLKAIYAAPFYASCNTKSISPADGMEKSYQEILKISQLCGECPLVLKGSESFAKDEKTPVSSPAAQHLAELASGYSPANPLYVVAIGAITNIASAILLAPEIQENIVVVWLGGHAVGYQDTREFNMNQDISAARILFRAHCPLVQLPCMGVVSEFRTTKPELLYWLQNKNSLCDYLVQNTIQEADSYAKGKAWSRVIWDVAAVGWLLNDNDRFMESRIIQRTLPEYDGYYRINPSNSFMRYVYHINRDAMFEDLFGKLNSYGE